MYSINFKWKLSGREGKRRDLEIGERDYGDAGVMVAETKLVSIPTRIPHCGPGRECEFQILNLKRVRIK